jgi:hypothetical protein
MASIWVNPAQGNLLNDGQPWRHGDQVNLQLEFNADRAPFIESIILSGGSLPPGLFFNGATKKVQGTIAALPKDQPSYPVVFRVKMRDSGRTYDRSFRWIVDLSDEEQRWGSPAGLQNLGAVNRGSNVNIQLDIVNPDNDALVYKAVGYKGPPGSHAGLPNGLSIDNFGRLVGSPTITGNQAGDYYFRIYARDPDDLDSVPRGEGNPRTSEKIYQLTLTPNIVLDARLSDVVKWETPSGSLGSCYETYPSYFAVKASPQYETSGGSASETQTIRYTLTPSSKLLPSGFLLDPLSGMILGRAPYVAVSKTYEFTVEARVVFVSITTGAVRLSSIASERTFSVTIKSIFATDAVTSLEINVPGAARQKIIQWVFSNQAEDRTIGHELTILGRASVFRPTDQYFGRVRNYRILLVNGLNYIQDGSFQERLKDYHHPTNLRIGHLTSAKARTPEGTHIYDILYLTVIDPLEGAGGFDALGKEQVLNRYTAGQKPTAIPQLNLKANDSRYFPSSIKNLRSDMLNRNNRNDWAGNNESAGSRGYGVSGKEGLPLWMMCEQTLGDPTSVLGYQCAIELAYVKPGGGPAAVKALTTAGINEDLQGTVITVDRYLLLSNGTASTTFDGPEHGTDEITTFDGIDNLLTPTTALTTFDTSLQSESKYYKFPPGDI